MIPNNQHDPDTRFRRLVEAIKFVYASTFFARRRAISARDRPDRPTTRRWRSSSRKSWAAARRPLLSRSSRVSRARSTSIRLARGAPEDGVVEPGARARQDDRRRRCRWTLLAGAPAGPAALRLRARPVARTQTDVLGRQHGEAARSTIPPPRPSTSCARRSPRPRPTAPLAPLASTYDAAVRPAHPGDRRARAARPDLRSAARARAAARSRDSSSISSTSRARALGDRGRDRVRGHDPRRSATRRRASVSCRCGRWSSRRSRSRSCRRRRTRPTLVASASAMGNGIDRTIRDIVYVRPDRFDAAATRDDRGGDRGDQSRAPRGRRARTSSSASAAGARRIRGSAFRWTGVRSRARVSIVEASLPAMEPDPSQGSHFFHNLTSVRRELLLGAARRPRARRLGLARAQSAHGRDGLVRHVRLDAPLTVKIDGRRGAGVIRRAASA